MDSHCLLFEKGGSSLPKRHLSVSLGKEKASTEKSWLLKGSLFLKTTVQRGIKKSTREYGSNGIQRLPPTSDLGQSLTGRENQ